jgi:hypothetical protein
MLLAVVTMLWLAGVAVASAVSLGIGASRQGRLHAWEQLVRAAARGGLDEAETGTWANAAAGAPPGAVVPLPPLRHGPVSISREARRLGTGPLWVVTARAELQAVGGQRLALAEQGLLVRLAWSPADSAFGPVVTSRPWFSRPE